MSIFGNTLSLTWIFVRNKKADRIPCNEEKFNRTREKIIGTKL